MEPKFFIGCNPAHISFHSKQLRSNIYSQKWHLNNFNESIAHHKNSIYKNQIIAVIRYFKQADVLFNKLDLNLGNQNISISDLICGIPPNFPAKYHLSKDVSSLRFSKSCKLYKSVSPLLFFSVIQI